MRGLARNPRSLAASCGGGNVALANPWPERDWAGEPGFALPGSLSVHPTLERVEGTVGARAGAFLRKPHF